MGNFYTSHTLRGVGQQDVAAHMRGKSAVVSPAQDGCVVVFDEESDDQDPQVVADLASRLSGALSCPLLAIINHDDDVLMYHLYVKGELIDEYNSCPDYFDEGDGGSGFTSGNAEKLCEAFGVPDAEAVEGILRKSSLDADGYVFELERHQALFQALGLPEFAVGVGYRYFDAGEIPAGLDQNACLRTS